MTAPSTTAPDIRTMGIVHAALRRDLDRAAMVLDGPVVIADDRLQALGGHVVWLMDFLHHHHEGEDERLYPLVRAGAPEAGGLLDAMAGEHRAVGPSMAEVTAAGAAAAAGAPNTAVAAERLAAAISDLRTVLDPHLEREEVDLMPVVAQAISGEDWRAFEQSNTEVPKRELAYVGHWILDNLAPEPARLFVGVIPPVPRFILLNLLGGPYRRTREALWGGTPALAVRSRPLWER